MPDVVVPDATFTREGDRVTARFARILDNPVPEVWASLTAPGRLAQWLAPGEIDLAVGGRAFLDFAESGIIIDSRVTAVEPMALLEYSWGRPGEPPRPLRWTLKPLGAQTRLTLSLTVPFGEDVARSAAGWAAHLEMLSAHLAGATLRFPFPTFQAARAAYAEQLSAIGWTRTPVPTA